MKTRALILIVILGAFARSGRAHTEAGKLPAPGFHHLHLNGEPGRGDYFYARQFPSTTKASWAGIPALKSPNNAYLLFTKVNTPPLMQPQTAMCHFGWHVVDVRKYLEMYKQRPQVKHLPLYTTDEGGSRRARCRQPRRLGRQAEKRGGQVPRAGLQAWRHACRDD